MVGRVRSVLGVVALAFVASSAWSQTAVPGRAQYDQFCARCHGGDGRGGQMGPGIVARLPVRSDGELATLVRDGVPAKGMPGVALAQPELRQLLAFLRTLRAPDAECLCRVFAVETLDGATLDGVALNQSSVDLQLLADDGRLHLLRRSGSRYRRVTSDVDWPGYHGSPTGNRFSRLDQISERQRRAAGAGVDVHGLGRRAASGHAGRRRRGHVRHQRQRVLCARCGIGPPHLAFPATAHQGVGRRRRRRDQSRCGGSGDRVFMVTDDARLLALNRFTGALAVGHRDGRLAAELRRDLSAAAVGTLVMSGISGGDEGVRGFLAAFDQATGREVWRFWTVPRRGEPGSETWRGNDIEHGCASTWLTGTYDAELGTLYWPTGNPCPDYDGRERLGDNLYSDSILALDPASGRLKWHFQYTPHDVWDWDAQQPPVLVDAQWHGQPRRLLLHANRNGFFYVLDRTSGALLQANPFVKKLTWATGIGPDGRPVLTPGQAPTPEGVTVCPAVEGATNWFSTAFSPATGLYYVQALEKCTVYTPVALHVAGRQLVLQRDDAERRG